MASRSDIQLSSCELSDHSFKHNGREYVPDSLRLSVLSQLHDSPAAGHRGPAALFSLLSRQYWWPNSYKDAQKYA